LSHQHSDSTIPPHLFENVTLCLELDGDIIQSIEAYHKTLGRYNGHGIVPEVFDDSSKIVVQPADSNHGSAGLNACSTSMTKAQANLVVRELRSICNGRLCHGSDQIAVRYLMGYLAGGSDEPREYQWANGTYTSFV
jgi:putative lipase involved disintegration of autophagic bodies